MITKRLQTLLVSGTLMLAGATLAAAQPAQWGYDDRGYQNFYFNAKDFGYQDGFNDGQNDRLTGHSYRPTHDDNFKHADRGFSRGYGDRNYYKEIYRRAYEDGYDRGYNSSRYRRRSW
jgi:hypothetical protein